LCVEAAEEELRAEAVFQMLKEQGLISGL